MTDLVDVPTEELVKEMQRRLSCQSKPEKHVILIGALFLTSDHIHRHLGRSEVPKAHCMHVSDIHQFNLSEVGHRMIFRHNMTVCLFRQPCESL